MPLLPEAESVYAELLAQIKRARWPDLQVVGIHSGGVWLARRLARDLELKEPIGELDISYYRDDFDRIGLHANSPPTRLPFDVANSHILLVDDVLYTGRTIRGALNVLFDYGRPARVSLAALIDRGGRELPVAPTYCGAVLSLAAHETLVLHHTNDVFHLTLQSTSDGGVGDV